MTDLLIINRALNRIGAKSASSMSDTALNQAKAILAYPTARDEMLRLFNWPSVAKRAALFDVGYLRCQWILSHTYHVGDYVTNDTGKVYQCITAGVSAGAGGPTGTTSNITDGTVHWSYIAANDLATNWAWCPSTTYAVGDMVGNQDGHVYVCITAGATAASGGPTTTAADITDNVAHWSYYATIPDNLTAFMYQYLYPADCVRLLKIPNVISKDPEAEKGAMYRRISRLIYTDVPEAIAVYTERADPATWDELLQAVVVLRIAQMIAFDVTSHADVVTSVTEEFNQTARFARGVAALEGSEGVQEGVRWEDV